jgi:NADH-quinone oxidoreductase subunit E
MSELLSPAVKQAIDLWIEKYPKKQKQSAVLSALHIVQEANEGWLSRELLDAVADYLSMPPVAVYEVATFYSMYELEKGGRHKIDVCTNISCMLRGSGELVKHLENKLGVKVGGTTPDGKYSLREVECLAACTKAPVCQIAAHYHEELTPEKIDTILDSLE